MDASTNSLARRRPLIHSGDVQVKHTKHAVRWVRARAELRGHILLLDDVPYEIFDAVLSSERMSLMRASPEFVVSVKPFEKPVRSIRIRSAYAASWVHFLTAAAAINRTASHWSVSIFSDIIPIGHGGGGNVYLVTHNSRRYALKVIAKAHVLASSSTLRHTLDERLSLEILRGVPFIVRLEHAFQDANAFYLLTEFCSGGDLRGLLKRSPKRRLSEATARPLFAQIISAVSVAHSHDIIIRDIKPDNILLTAGGDVRVCDFGLSKILPGRFRRTKSFCGTTQFMSPDLLSRKPYGISIDLWGLGALFYTVLVGITPFEDPTNRENEKHDIYGRIRTDDPIIPQRLSQDARDMIEGLLRKEEHLRWNLSELMECRYFSGVDWEKLKSHDKEEELEQPLLKNENYAGTTDVEKQLTTNFDMAKLKFVPPLLLEKQDETSTSKSKYSNNVVGFAFNTASSITISSDDTSDGSLTKINSLVENSSRWKTSSANFRWRRTRAS